MAHWQRQVVLSVLALALGAGLAAAQGPKWPSSPAPRALSAREVKFPPFEVRTLPNGLQVVVVTHDEQPAVSLRLIVRAGGAEDPARVPGVAAMVATLLDQGTTSRSAQQVAETIDSVGGELETGAGRDLSYAHVVVMKDSLALGMDLLADVVRHPVFREEELDRQRRQTLSALQVSYQDPEYLADVVFDRLVYGFNPYGSPGSGTPDSVRRIARADLLSFHRDYFAPNNCLLAVVGDLTVGEALHAATAAFGDWERRVVPSADAPAPPSPTRRVVVLDKPGAVQTEIRVGHLGIPRKNPDYTALDLAIKILGGEGANRLHRVLRTERGLTYGASADIETLERSGEFVARTNTRSEATGEVLRLLASEFSRLRRERVGDRELSDAKAYLTGHFPLTIETPDDIAMQVLDVLFYGLPVEELQTVRQRVNALSSDDVARVTGRYIRPDQLAVVLVGDSSVFLDQLKGAGFGQYEVIRLSDLDLSAADLKKREFAGPGVISSGRAGGRWPSGLPLPVSARLQVPASQSPSAAQATGQAVPGETAEAIMRRAVEAAGGVERLRAVKTVRAVATTTLMLPQGAVRAQTTTYIEYPDRFRVEAHLATGLVVQVFAGEGNVWVQDPAKGVMEPPAQARRDFKASVQRDLVSLLLRAASGELELRLPEADATVRATQNVRVVEVSGRDLDPVLLYVDGTSGLILRESYTLRGGQGAAEEMYTDYRPVDGLKVPFKASVFRNNLPVLVREVSEYVINPPLTAGLFDRPKAPSESPRPR